MGFMSFFLYTLKCSLINMLVCVTLIAIFASTPCRAFPTIPPSEDLIAGQDRYDYDNLNQDILAILNTANEPNNDESNYENESLNENLPKITVWQFPNERRVFIGDIEVFINSTEDEEYSHEVMDPDKAFVRHPHKHHGSHTEFSDDEQLPAFKKNAKRNNDEEIELIELVKRINSGLEGAKTYLPELNPDLHDLVDKNGIDLFNTKEIIPGTLIDRQRRDWGIREYLEWLLNGLNIPVSVKSNVENQNEEANDEIVSDERIKLPPIDPEILNVLRTQFENEKRKRSINSESNVNLLTSDDQPDEESDEDSDDQDDSKDSESTKEFFNDFFKILQSDKELYSILLAVYYYGK